MWFSELKEDFQARKLHPKDLKQGLISIISDILFEIRVYIPDDIDYYILYRSIYKND